MRIDSIDPEIVREGFEIYGENGHVVCLVGGGGKTTLLYHMARMAAEEGKKVLITTTTHLKKPHSRNFATTLRAVDTLWKKNEYALIGTLEQGTGKLTLPDVKMLVELMNKADLVIVEADGAKRCPCKVPREKEPVLLKACDIVTAVFGVSAIGKPLKDVCFGCAEAQKLLGVDENHILTEADAAKILASPKGGRKGAEKRMYHVVLNQCDDNTSRKMGKRIAKLLAQQGIDHVYVTSFDPSERA